MTALVPAPPPAVGYGEPIETEISRVTAELAELASLPAAPRWVALRLIEGDAVMEATVGRLAGTGTATVLALARGSTERIRAATGEDPALLIADARFAWAHALAGAAVEREMVPRSRTDRIDDVLTSRWLGIPIFLALMWVVFKLVTDVAAPFVEWTEAFVAGPVSSLIAAGLGAAGAEGTWVSSLVVDGAIGGVGSVLVFMPVLLLLYMALGVLEDSGYMARAAFLMDRLMRPIGLSGKSFLPLLLGFGCNVPGIYATRVLSRHRDRVLTSLLVPFVTCAARLPVYVLLAGVFFPAAPGTVVFTMYVASIAVVLTTGAALDRIVLRTERAGSFLLELPPYRRPSATVLRRFVGSRLKAFLTRAGTVILACSLAVWMLLAIPVGGGGFADTELPGSAFAAVARRAAPALEPAGLGTWEISGTLLSGVVAKEVVVATLDQVYAGTAGTGGDGRAGVADELARSGRGLLTATGEAALAVPGVIGIQLADRGGDEAPDIAEPLRAGLDASSGGHASLAAGAFLAFILLYVPCMATVAAIGHELGRRWAAVSVGLNLAVAWTVAVLIFQAGRALGIG